MQKRLLGRSKIEVSALGLGCWAIGGPAWRADRPIGWGQVDDDQSIRAIHKALDMGVNLLDTSDSYGCGHSERVIARAIEGKRSRVVIATKFGFVTDENTRHITGESSKPEYIRSACEASLKRLNTDYIDLYQFHLGRSDDGPNVHGILEELVTAGKIRYYGWSTDSTDRARIFAQGQHCTAAQHSLNVFEGNTEILDICEQFDLASINKNPLSKGILTGKFNPDSTLPKDDVRCKWDFKQGDEADKLKKLDAIRQILTSGGRTLAQGALCWLWAKSKKTIPIPGFKTVTQVQDNAGALSFDPLTAVQMKEIDALLKQQT